MFYVCEADRRVIVPKKPKWLGRTLNFAHPLAFLVLLLTVLAVAFPLILFRHIEKNAATILFLGIIAAIIAFYYCFELRRK